MIKERIIEMIKSELMIDKFDLDADLVKDYEIDSIGLLDFIMSIEEEFDIEISDSELAELKTVNDVIAVVERKAGK
ncbi:phosphopantetheine-binding protein [Helcococcus ovis]|uniref:Acyl carrier protein n=1 Tax=Helcococcus ovis TaxID=72026 RepID=A0A4R9C5G0_9FIRM|nr:phosphopantetheine-binding protein [Helcococcus ovis]TFF64888.1 acyl carrier protein [Helcococcus ovis]TFF67165.1 acyl carrier protein [Helcococcus ovis]TFF67940.1 acyl carrier protein [Helcococcus ovis]WNZ01895.1 phosphopantetheine-binding protein [Helcococcus ovis]